MGWDPCCHFPNGDSLCLTAWVPSPASPGPCLASVLLPLLCEPVRGALHCSGDLEKGMSTLQSLQLCRQTPALAFGAVEGEYHSHSCVSPQTPSISSLQHCWAPYSSLPACWKGWEASPVPALGGWQMPPSPVPPSPAGRTPAPLTHGVLGCSVCEGLCSPIAQNCA